MVNGLTFNSEDNTDLPQNQTFADSSILDESTDARNKKES